MANLNAFLGPVMPNLFAFQTNLDIVVPDDEYEVLGVLPTPVMPGPPGGEPTTVNYKVIIAAQIEIQDRVEDVSEESSFSTIVSDPALNIQPPEEDQEYVDFSTPGPIDYAINGQLFDGTPTITAGNPGNIFISLLRHPADTATYIVRSWIARYYRVL